MTFVVDLGSFPHEMPAGGIEESIPLLIDEFNPRSLWAFDPWPDQPDDHHELIGDTLVWYWRYAAWTEHAVIDYDPRELGSTVMREKNLHGEWRRPEPMRIEAFDFSRWLGLRARGTTQHWIVKMDIEGAEFPVLKKMIADGTDKLVSMLLIEWHDNVMEPQFRDERVRLVEQLSCPMREWH